MTLHPQARALLDAFSDQSLPPFEQMSPTQARLVALGFRDLQGEPEPVGEVRDVLVPGPAGMLPVRVYHPAPGETRPLVVYFHGGGWVFGDLEIVDKPCRALANVSRCVVASVNYRLSPESKFPAAAEDCYAATKWLAEHAAENGSDQNVVAVAGDSAGGNLAAVVALMARDRGGPKRTFQLLIYPVMAPARGTEFSSYTQNADGYLLTRAAMEWFWDHYLATPVDGESPCASPLHAPDLAGLPPAMVVTAQFDPLRDEGRAYANRLRDAGVAVRQSHYDDMIHGFFWMAGALDRGKELIAEIGNELRQRLAVP
jgi:acetyl esterase